MDQKQTEDQAWNEKYPEKDFKKTIYSFSAGELAKVSPWDVQIQLGAIAQNVLTNIMRNECLKRVGEKNSPDTGIKYDTHTGQFFVFSPKVWCSLCKSRKAEFSYDNRVFCEGCIEILKKQKLSEATTKEQPKVAVKKPEEAKN